jgi:hypothetical protein
VGLVGACADSEEVATECYAAVQELFCGIVGCGLELERDDVYKLALEREGGYEVGVAFEPRNCAVCAGPSVL